MLASMGRDLAYHHSEIARIKEAIAAARPNSRRASLMRAILRYHEDILARPADVLR